MSNLISMLRAGETHLATRTKLEEFPETTGSSFCRRIRKARSVWTAVASAPPSRIESVADGGNNGGRVAGWRHSGAKAAAVHTLARVSTVLLAMTLLLCGCVSPRPYPMTPLAGMPAQEAERMAQQTLARLFPAQYRSVQRAIITVAGKQFTCDGVLEVSTNAGWQLAIVSNLGLVAGLRVNRDGSCEVLQVTPLFRESWTRQFVARDVRRLFIPPPEFVAAGRLADGRLVCETAPESDGAVARYIFSADGQQWQELEVSRGDRQEYRVVLHSYRTFAGTMHAVPAEMELQAENYQLHLRPVELDVNDQIAPEAAR